MKINTDINLLGGLPDWGLILHFLRNPSEKRGAQPSSVHTFTHIKTEKSVKRFENAIYSTLLAFKNENIRDLITTILEREQINDETKLLLFWNASANNDLLHYLNSRVYFPALYSGRVSIKKEEVEACISELRETESVIKEWTQETIKTVARKYLTLLKKFGLMDGAVKKTMVYQHMSDKMFVVFVYWITAISERPNLLKDHWLPYALAELQYFLDRVAQKKFTQYFDVVYTGDRLNIDTKLPYYSLYEHITKT